MWNDKRYHSLDYHLKELYGEKIYKLSLNGGMTCPNRDGTLGNSGCIFCSNSGSGDFAASPSLSIFEQIESEKEHMQGKRKVSKYIAYFQAYTNTYAPVPYLKKIFTEAVSHPDIAILSIATRPDCLNDDVIELLIELNKIKPVWIELGLQTIHEDTALYIKRGYKLPCFENTLNRLNTAGIDVIVHVIAGLPFESTLKFLQTIDYLSHKNISGIKIHLLHVLKDTELSTYINDFHILSMEEYVDLVVQALEHLPQNIIIHRITGDGPKEQLISPLWSLSKRTVLNTINKTMKDRDSWQGKQFKQPYIGGV